MFSWKIPPYHQYPQTPVRLKDGDEPFVDLALYSQGEVRVLSDYLQARRHNTAFFCLNYTVCLKKSARGLSLSGFRRLASLFRSAKPF